MFHLDVAYVAVAIHVCCKCVFQMFQLFHLDVACFHLDAAYVAEAIPVCCKCMFQMFHLFQTYIASVLSRCCIYCNGYTRMLQVYVSNVSALSNVCCKCFYLDVAYVAMPIHKYCKRIL